MGRFRVAAIGSRIWVDYFAEAFHGDEDIEAFAVHSFAQLKRVPGRIDLLYVIFGWLDTDHVLSFLQCSLQGVPTVIHWIGTDVWRLVNPGSLSVRMKFKRLAVRSVYGIMRGCRHLAGAPWLAQELEGVGIKSTFIPVVNPLLDSSTPVYLLPDAVSIVSYIPLGREEFYGEESVLEAAKNNPDVKFIVVANSPRRKPDHLTNVEYHGWVSRGEMEDIFRRTTCYMRITKHDGLSGGIEALLRGRYWIFSYDHPHVYRASTTEEIQAAIDDVKLKTVPNYGGAQYVREHYSTSTVVNALKDFFGRIR